MRRQILLKSLDGSTRLVPDQVEYRLREGEWVADSVPVYGKCSNCGGPTEDIPAG